MSTEAINRQRADTADKGSTDERAVRAVKVFRGMQSGLTSYARAITGNQKVRVEIGAGASTDGNIIRYAPPIRLGDNLKHDRQMCDKRNVDTGLLACPACAVREEVLVNIYHEIAHIAFKTFEQTTERARTDAIAMAIEEWGTDYSEKIRKAIEAAPWHKKKDYLNLSSLISPFLPSLVNALEDARVDASMFQARKGIRKMLVADTYALLREGMEVAEGTPIKDPANPTGDPVPAPLGHRVTWREAELNAQATLACYLQAADYPGWEQYLHPKIGQDFADLKLRGLLTGVVDLLGAADTYALSFPVLARLRELGYLRMPEEDPQEVEQPESPNLPDDPEPEPEPDNQENENDDDGQDEPVEPGPDDGVGEESDEQPGSPGDDDGDSGGEGAGEDQPDADAPLGEPAEGADAPGPGEDEGDPGEGESPGQGDDLADAEGGAPGAGDDPDDAGSEEGGDGGEADPADGPADPGEGDDGEAPGEGAGAGGDGEDLEQGEAPLGDPGSDDDDRGAGSASPGDESGEPEAGGPDAGAGVGDADGPEDGAGEQEGEVDDDTSDGLPEQAGDGGSGDAGGEPGGDPGAADRAESGSEGEPDEGADGVGLAGGSTEPGEPERDEDGLDQGDPGRDGSEAGELDGAGQGEVPSPELDDALADDVDAAGERDVSQDPGDPGSDDGPLGDAQEGDGGSDGPLEQEPDEQVAGPDDRRSPAEADAAADQGDPDDGESEPLESGADEGRGGIKAEPLPDYGTPESVSDAVDQVHDSVMHGGEETQTTEESKAIQVAMIQGAYFETPSAEVELVIEHRPTDENPDDCWNYTRTMDHDELKYLGIKCDTDVPEAILGPNLLKLRRIFSDNKNTAMERNRRAGRVNSRVLGKRAPVGDDRLFQKKRRPGKRDYAVLIGIDISSSTFGDNLALAKRAAMAQAMLCHRLGISFSVFAHCATVRSGYVMEIYRIKDFNQPWNDAARERLNGIAAMGGNLDGHTMEFYRRELDKVEATDKVLLYYTDGKMPAANHDEELEVLQREIKTCRRKGYTLLGVGIRTDSPVRHGLDTVEVNGDDDLRHVVDHLGKRLG